MKFTRIVSGSLVVALGVAIASEASAQEIQASQTRPSQAMLSSGAFALGVPYVSSLIVAAESSHPGDKDLYVPVAGPWMDLGDRHCAFGQHCGNEGLYKGLLVADGIIQGLGALEIVGAFLFPETVTVTSAAAPPRDGTPKLASLRIGPSGIGSGFGVVALGAF